MQMYKTCIQELQNQWLVRQLLAMICQLWNGVNRLEEILFYQCSSWCLGIRRGKYENKLINCHAKNIVKINSHQFRGNNPHQK